MILPADYMFVAAVLLVIAANLYFAPRIRSDRIAMQWGFDGKPTWSAPKALALWGMVAFMLLIRTLIWLAVTYTPQHVHGVQIGIAGFSIVILASHLFVLKMAERAN